MDPLPRELLAVAALARVADLAIGEAEVLREPGQVDLERGQGPGASDELAQRCAVLALDALGVGQGLAQDV